MLVLERRAIDAVLLDIEGTTTPIAFVYETLFGFARAHLHEFLGEHEQRPDVRRAIDGLRAEWADDVSQGSAPPPWPESRPFPLEAVAAYVTWLMDRDRKSPALKLLQGQIWEGGYESGALVSDLFPDVAPAIAEWRGTGLKVAIYSSGSVLAQRLLFGHTREGDLTSSLDAFFDTGVGPKISAQSYRAVASALGAPPGRLLFVSDTASEIDAASAAGCLVALCVRPGNPRQSPSTAVDVIYGLHQIVMR